MATKLTIKDLREMAEQMLNGKITNREKLSEALPVLIELQKRIKLAQDNLDASDEMAALLSEACTAYAEKTPGVLIGGALFKNQNGVMVGDFKADDGHVYHLAMGFHGYKRVSGAKMDAEFRATLPPEWLRTKSELNTTAINNANPSDKELAKFDLCEKPNNVWSLAKTAEEDDE